jgi:hypothetical protein
MLIGAQDENAQLRQRSKTSKENPQDRRAMSHMLNVHPPLPSSFFHHSSDIMISG